MTAPVTPRPAPPARRQDRRLDICAAAAAPSQNAPIVSDRSVAGGSGFACERMPAGYHVSHRTNNTFVLSPTSHVHKSAPLPMSARNCGHSNSAATEQRSSRSCAACSASTDVRPIGERCGEHNRARQCQLNRGSTGRSSNGCHSAAAPAKKIAAPAENAANFRR